MERHGLSERRACSVVRQKRSSQRYQSKKNDTVLREALKRLAAERPRFGHRRLAVFLKREGIICNHKRIRRVYRDLGLAVWRRKGRKRAPGTRLPLPRPDMINQIWSLDFVSDALSCGRRIRLLGVMDQCSREGLCLAVDTSLPGERVVRELEYLVGRRGCPKVIVSDNGTELTSRAVLMWAQEKGIEWHYITPGKHTENGYTESMNGKIRDEFLNQHWFTTLEEARLLAAQWLHDYNHVRPHSSLNYLTPMQFIERHEAVGVRPSGVTPPASCRTKPINLHYQKILLPRGT